MTNFSELLKGLKLKSTPKRLAILEVLDQEHVYLSPEEVWMRLKSRFRSLGLPTIYRNLEDLHSSSVISKIIHPDRKLYYYFCRNLKHHHHFICVSCRKVEDIDFCAEEQIEKIVKRGIKGKVLSHIMQINGLCGVCLTNGEIEN